jgi:hypothetical protein
MLNLVASKEEKIEAVEKFASAMKIAWPGREERSVIWRPSSRKMEIVHNGLYWCCFITPNQSDKSPRYWNPFGLYRNAGSLQIAVEINIPTESNTKRVAGFFAKDGDTNKTYLVHSGGVGGGRKGVGRDAFLEWSKIDLVEVLDAAGNIRRGIAIGVLESESIANDVQLFISKILAFKQNV